MSEAATSEEFQLVIAEGTIIVPIEKLAKAEIEKLAAEPGDYAISRPGSRSSAKIISAELGKFLKEFSSPTSITAAILRFADPSGSDAEQLLDELFPVLNDLLRAGFLMQKQEAEAAAKDRPPVLTSFRDLTILRSLQILDDVEVYSARTSEGDLVALKIGARENAFVSSSLTQEASVLEKLAGSAAPRKIDSGVENGRTFLCLEWIHGIAVDRAADAVRREGSSDRSQKLLALAVDVASAYAAFHEIGVVHGDVHPRNVLVSTSGVRIIDFGLSNIAGGAQTKHRGGVGYFFEPEYVAARLKKKRQPPASPAGEQYSIAVLLYRLLTGAWYLPFSLQKDLAYKQILESPPQPFAAHGIEPSKSVEEILARALSKRPKDRFPSVRELADALKAASSASHATAAASSHLDLEQFVSKQVERILREGPDFELPKTLPASVNMGLAGMTYGLYRVSINLRSPELLALADQLAERAAAVFQNDPDIFWNEELGMTEELITKQSAFNAAPGISVVRAFVAHGRGDPYSLNLAIQDFLERSAGVEQGKTDFTFGKAGTLIVCANLSAVASCHPLLDVKPLRHFGDRVEAALLADLEKASGNAGDGAQKLTGYFGAAHGWAGNLYAVLRWRERTGAEIPPLVMKLLDRIALHGVPIDRGIAWPQTLPAPKPVYLGGWCNGSAGFVYLWTAAHRLLKESRWLALAEGAGWSCWDRTDPGWDLCCGRSGKSYALLELANVTGDRAWRDRALTLALSAVKDVERAANRGIGLYKGLTGPLVLASDLASGAKNSIPFFGDEP